MSTIIREATIKDASLLAILIRNSFQDVAERFDLTLANCPTHPSNCTTEWIEADLAKGIKYFILENSNHPCGCVGLEHARPDVCYLKRLAVLPQFRKKGFGQALVNYGLGEAQELDTNRVEIGLISAHTELQGWYRQMGFSVQEVMQFEHLPFEVTCMVREI